MQRWFVFIVLVAMAVAAEGNTRAWAATKQPVQSPRAQGSVLKAITIEGNERVERETILSYITLTVGDYVSQGQIDASLKQLFGTGLFADVRIEKRGTTLFIKVKENPIVNQVAFEGNKRMKKEDLEAEISLKSRSVYTKQHLQQDVSRLLDIYRRSGRFAATVVPKIIELPQNRINLVFEIDEGPKTPIKKIVFVGNNEVTDQKLENVIHSRESRWYRFFSSDDTYDVDRIEFDKELLRKYYTSIGFADFKVVSAIAELTPKKDAFILTYTLEEGELYQFGKVEVSSEIEKIRTNVLQKLVKTKAGQTFDASLVEDTIDSMVKALADEGYAFVDVDPQYERDPATRIVHLNYVVKEGRKVYVNRINIKGNVRTEDQVIRREFRITEGDPYNAAFVRRSEQRIRNLGFFDKVEVSNARTDVPDKIDIDVNVSEKSTGEVNFGAGYSTTDGALASVGIRERNLLGKGQDLRLDFQRAQKKVDIDLGFTEPRFLNRDLAVGFDLFSITRYRKTESSFNSESKGGVLRATYDLTEYLQHTLRYSYKMDNITDVPDDASRYIKEQEGRNTTSLVGHTLTYDKRDNKFNPTTGYMVKLSQEVAGAGGDSKFLREEARTGYYLPLVHSKKLVLQFSANAGHVMGIGGDDVRITDRFFIGGDDLRGFDNAGIGPRDIVTDDALGGNIYYTASSELVFPLGLPAELDFSGSLFVDMGSLFNVDATGSDVVDDASPRISTGVGVSWKSAIGPIRVDVAYPIMKEQYDKTQQLHFSVGTRF